LQISGDGHEQQACTFGRRDPRQFRKLDIVADQDRNLATVGVEHFHALPRRNAPPCALGGRYMQLVLLVVSSIAPKQVRNVVEVAVFYAQVRAGNDVDVVFDGEPIEQLLVVVGELAQTSCGQARTRSGNQRQQLVRESFGEQ